MPITASLGGKDYTFGRGKVFFDRFAPNVTVGENTRGEGERYLGNTPEFNNSSESENLDHFDSDSGVRVKDDSVQLSFEQTASFTCDNISADNIALFFLGDKLTVAQVAAEDQAESIAVKRGMMYQLGRTASNPPGVRNVTNVAITGLVLNTDYQVDEARGRIYILPNAPAVDAAGETISITYDVGASSRERIISGSQSIYGSLRFVADNPKGPNRDYYFPYVKLAPDGDYSLKGDDWQTMGFTMEVLKLSTNIASLYIDGQAVAS